MLMVYYCFYVAGTRLMNNRMNIVLMGDSSNCGYYNIFHSIRQREMGQSLNQLVCERRTLGEVSFLQNRSLSKL